MLVKSLEVCDMAAYAYLTSMPCFSVDFWASALRASSMKILSRALNTYKTNIHGFVLSS